MQNRKDIRWPYLRQIKFQNSFICWKEKKNLKTQKSLKYQVFISALLLKKKTLNSQNLLTNTKTNVFGYLCFLGRADCHLLHSHKRSPVPEKSHHLVTEKKKASAYCMRKKPCGLVDRLNTCECQSTLPSHKLLLLLVHAEYDFLHGVESSLLHLAG